MDFKRKNISQFSRNIGVAVILFTLSTALVLAAPRDAARQVQAQGGTNYTATWTATDLIVARLVSPDGSTQAKCESAATPQTAYGDPSNSEVAIGPATWVVKGQIDSTSKFKETWTTATLPTGFEFTQGHWRTWFLGGYCTSYNLKVVGNQNQDDWTTGYFNDMDLGYSSVDFRKVAVTDSLTSISNIDPGRAANIGKATSCQYTNRCIFTSGAYAWTTFHEIDEANNGKYVNAGMLLPVRWSVVGLLCEAGDSRCD